MNQRALFLFLNLLFFQNAFGQIFGTVANKTTLLKIENVIVEITGSKNQENFTFTTTNKEGFFELDVDSSWYPINIECRKYGFETLTLKIEKPTKTINLYLIPKDEKDIIVKANPIISRNGDTTRFNAAAFKNGTETNIKELIERLPDFRLDNGMLYFKNKPIQNILVENDDLLGSSYSGYINNFGATGIETFEVIENYIDSMDVLAGLKSSKTILNVIYKKTKRYFSTNIVGLNYNGKYGMAKADLVRLGKKTKNLFFVNINNLGFTGANNNNPTKNYFNNSNYFNYQSLYYAASPINVDVKGGINGERLLFNKSIYSSLNQFKKTKRKAVIRNNFNFYYDVVNQQLTTMQTIINGITSINYYNNSFKKLNPFYIGLETKIQKKLKPTLSYVLSNNIFVNNANNNALGQFQQNNLEQKFAQQQYKINTVLNIINVKNEKKPLLISILIDAQKKPLSFNLIGNSLFNPLFLMPVNNTLQNLNIALANIGVYANKKIPLKKGNINFTASSLLQTENINGYIGYKQNNINLALNNNYIKQAFTILSNSIDAKWQYKKYTIGNKLEQVTFNINSTFTNKLLWLPYLNVEFILLKKFKATLDFNVQRRHPSFNNIANFYTINGPSNLQTGNNNFGINKSYMASANFFNTKAWRYKYYSSNYFNFSVTKNNNAYVTNRQFNTNFSISKDSLFFNTTYTGNLFYGKSLSFSSNNFNLNLGINYNNANFINFNILQFQSNITPYGLLSYQFNKPKKYFYKIDIIFRNQLSKNNSFSSKNFIPIQNQWNTIQNISYSFKNGITTEAVNEFLSIKPNGQNRLNISLFDFKVKFPITKSKTVFLLEGRNVLNAKNINEVSLQNNVNYQTVYYLFPRTIVAKVLFNF